VSFPARRPTPHLTFRALSTTVSSLLSFSLSRYPRSLPSRVVPSLLPPKPRRSSRTRRSLASPLAASSPPVPLVYLDSRSKVLTLPLSVFARGVPTIFKPICRVRFSSFQASAFLRIASRRVATRVSLPPLCFFCLPFRELHDPPLFLRFALIYLRAGTYVYTCVYTCVRASPV